MTVKGLHHVTSVVTDMEKATRFYVDVLGMVQIARTVNFDETDVLQLYCGDEPGTPGTIVSLIQHSTSLPGVAGTGQVGNITFGISPGSFELWHDHLSVKNIEIDGQAWSFDQKLLCFRDPDGLALSFVETADVVRPVRKDGPSVGRVVSLELQLGGFEHTARLLADVLGYVAEQHEGPVTRFRSSRSPDRFAVDLLSAPTRRLGVPGPGVVHHVAWSVGDPDSLASLRSRLVGLGFDATPVLDRLFFKAVYFTGPEGLSFAIATDEPGFRSTPDAEGLSGVVLPPWLEHRRGRIERRLRSA